MDISVIVPLFKGNKYIANIVDMVENNYTYAMSNGKQFDIEIIFVNDCPDEKIDAISSKYVDIRYVANDKNHGIHQTRINGIKLSKAEYIHMLDQDDIIDKEFYYTQLDSVGNADVVVCNGLYRGKKLIFDKEKDCFNKEELIKTGNKIVSPGQTIVKKNAIPNEWYENPLQNSGCDDWLLWILMVFRKRTFSYNSKVLYLHVEDGNNQSFCWDKMSVSLREIEKIINNQDVDKEIKEQSLKCIDKFIFDYNSFHAFEIAWGKISLEKLRCYLKENGIKTIAIYGYGNIGKKIVATLKLCKVKIWAIDRDLRYVEEEIKVYRPEDRMPETDLMIITPIRGGEEIRQRMTQNLDIKHICAVKEFIELLYL